MGRPKTSGREVVNPVPHSIANPSWKYRRLIIFSTLVLDAVLLVCIVGGWLFGVGDSTVAQIVAGGIIARSMAIVGSYVFGATWQDINIAKLLSQGRNLTGLFDRDGDNDKPETKRNRQV